MFPSREEDEEDEDEDLEREAEAPDSRPSGGSALPGPGGPSSQPGLTGPRSAEAPGGGRLFGPPPPATLGGSRPLPRPSSPLKPAAEDQDTGPGSGEDEDLWGRPGARSLRDRLGGDEAEGEEDADSPGDDESNSPGPGLASGAAQVSPAVAGVPTGSVRPLTAQPPARSNLEQHKDEADSAQEAHTGTPGSPGGPAPAPPAASPAAGSAGTVSPAVLPRPAAAPPAPAATQPASTGQTGSPVAEPARRTAVPSSEGKPAPRAPRTEWVLPKVEDMLKPAVRKTISDEELRRRAEIIETTLSSFGAPGRVVEVNRGPVITQFGVEPDYIDGRAGKRIKVKVGKISALADDLALALEAPSIRIEAPVPGKGFVGIEVPNAEPSIVSLRDVIDTPEFNRLKSPLKLALGQDVSGHPVVADLTSMPHLLIAGTTGSGKSVCVNGIICTMLMTCTPDQLKMIMVDPKRVELTNYNGIPHLMAPVVTELERIVGVLKWVQREMDDRYRKFAMAGARNITDYNGRIERGQLEGDRLPYIIVIVDELADLMMLAPDETERVITRLAQMARATGIHIIISTQRPSVDVVTGLIKANFPARIAFAVATGVDSRVILDMPGAEKLLGRGDMLFQAPDAPLPLRLQGTYVSDEEIEAIVNFWREQAPRMPAQQPVSFKVADEAPAAGASREMGVLPRSPLGDNGDEEGDELFDEAVELVRGMEKASISLLQRHLRIGYTRAARLIDLMEEAGVIGPHEGGSKPREVLDANGDPVSDETDE